MMSVFLRLLSVGLLLVLTTFRANATIVISPDATRNVTCSGGLCSSSSNNAVLNVSELQDLLASGDVTVTAIGTPSRTADIRIQTPLAWSNASTLTLDSYHSIVIGKAVLVTGLGGLTIVTNDGDSGGGLSFKSTGHVAFSHLSSALTINGTAYTLAGSIAALRADILSNSAGHYALASTYNAQSDGVYSQCQLPAFNGTMEGLGNAISNLTITNMNFTQYVALFCSIQPNGVVENLKMTNVLLTTKRGRAGGLTADNQGLLSGISVSGEIFSKGTGSWAGGIAAFNSHGTIVNSHSSARVHGGNTFAGGLVAENVGLIRYSYATGAVSSGSNVGGGLVGINAGGSSEFTIDSCYATGVVSNSGTDGLSGGLVGVNSGTVINSYAKGNVSGGAASFDGGLVGVGSPGALISNSYSTGLVSGGDGSLIGGLIGRSDGSAETTTYWNTTSSGVSDSSQGAGDVSNEPGITGLTTTQLQSGLPAGFDPSIWAVNATINGGYPYLLANIPP